MMPAAQTGRVISFKEFLASQESRLRAEQAAQEQARQDWIGAVDRLIERISAWIKSSDPHNLVKLDPQLLGDIDETGGLRKLDELAELRVSIGHQEVIIRPAVHDTLGPQWKPGEGKWTGRVDMMGSPYGYQLYRYVFADGREEWYVRNTRDYQIKALEQSSFDAALVDLFS